MSRVAKKPIQYQNGITVLFEGDVVIIKGPKGELSQVIHPLVKVESEEDGVISVTPRENNKESWMHAGTVRALINNMVQGVSQGFQKKLQLVGVGYRAQAKKGVLNLTVGYSHPVDIKLPEGISAETPTQTEIVLIGIDKQLLGQVAANIRSTRPPEPYKGKGIRYSDEIIHRKEAKKK